MPTWMWEPRAERTQGREARLPTRMSTIAANPWVVKVHANKGMIFPLAFISLLLVILVPLPTFILRLLPRVTITRSVIALVASIYVKSPREFAGFPSPLLAVTLFRLVLN